MGRTLTVGIDGMHCSGCETLVRDALEELDGVLNVRVSHKDGNAVVEYEPSRVSPAEIAAAIEAEGYRVTG